MRGGQTGGSRGLLQALCKTLNKPQEATRAFSKALAPQGADPAFLAAWVLTCLCVYLSGDFRALSSGFPVSFSVPWPALTRVACTQAPLCLGACPGSWCSMEPRLLPAVPEGEALSPLPPAWRCWPPNGAAPLPPVAHCLPHPIPPTLSTRLLVDRKDISLASQRRKLGSEGWG